MIGSLFGGRQDGVPDDVTGVLEIAGWLKESFDIAMASRFLHLVFEER